MVLLHSFTPKIAFGSTVLEIVKMKVLGVFQKPRRSLEMERRVGGP